MTRKPANRPTDAELAILQVLWDRGPSTVRDVHHRLGRSGTVGYTTVLKTLQIMTEKGLVRRDESRRAHVYSAMKSEEQTQQGLVGDLLDRAFQGSAGKLVLRALSSRRASREEIAEIRALLEQMTGEDDDEPE
jgi:BlaI family penicillinase repressor